MGGFMPPRFGGNDPRRMPQMGGPAAGQVSGPAQSQAPEPWKTGREMIRGRGITRDMMRGRGLRPEDILPPGAGGMGPSGPGLGMGAGLPPGLPIPPAQGLPNIASLLGGIGGMRGNFPTFPNPEMGGGMPPMQDKARMMGGVMGGIPQRPMMGGRIY